jgi:enediyne polyketide synthase
LKNSFLKQSGFDEKLFGIDLDYSGPQKQLVFTKKFPVTFRANQHLSRRVYFTNYFKWIGEMREYGSYPIFGDLAKMSEKGGWGMATNWVKLEILGEVKPGDIIEGRLWIENVTGNMDEIIDMAFEWRCLSIDGKYVRVATAKQRITWLKILGHGIAKVEKLPDFLRKFFDGMRPKIETISPLISLPEIYNNLDRGKQIFSLKNMIKDKHKLYEEVFPTSLENSNLIGNIYFANYVEWLSTVRDRYIYKLIPQYFRGLGEKGELICLSCNIDHLNEAMPFDDILVQMYLDSVYECGIDFHFEFYLLRENTLNKKLAFGKQKAVWMRWDNQKPVVVRLPEALLANLLDKSVPQSL